MAVSNLENLISLQNQYLIGYEIKLVEINSTDKIT